MDNGIYVNMPVLCLGKECDKCPDLDVNAEKTCLCMNEEELWDIRLECRKLKRCLRIKEMLEKNK